MYWDPIGSNNSHIWTKLIASESINTQSAVWVIPYKSTKKNKNIFFGDLWPKNTKVFDILVIKTFL